MSGSGTTEMNLSEFRRGNSFEFLELPHKMDFALVTAEEGKRIDAHIAAGQVEFGQIQAGMYDVKLR